MKFTGNVLVSQLYNHFNNPLERARKENHQEVVRLFEAAAAGFTFIGIRIRYFEKSKTTLNLIAIGCSGGEVERKAGNHESAVGDGSNIRLI